MSRGVLLATALVLATPAIARATVPEHSELAPVIVMPQPGDEKPELILAQRAIERSWGPAEGAPPPVPVPGVLSEGAAFAMSGIMPGAGQAYVGEPSAIWYALIEIAGWTSHYLFTRDASRESDHAAQFAGAPSDSTSGFSITRWASGAPGRDPSQLEALYAGDRDAYYTVIARDPAYLDGWAGPDPNATRADFQHLRDLSDASSQRARATQSLIWVNHIVSAFDALRAARLHNLAIRRNLDLQLKSSWHGNAPTVVATLERHF
jgi:hypothetical protein